MKSQKKFDFFSALNGREIMHWLGTPCFISKEEKKDPSKVQITTWDGRIFQHIQASELQPMEPSDMHFA